MIVIAFHARFTVRGFYTFSANPLDKEMAKKGATDEVDMPLYGDEV